MAEPSRVVLRYFNCRGRGQALRYLLVDQAVIFEDEVFLAGPSWLRHKATAAVSGPFASLPVLEWGDHRVGQTLAIASYLSRRLGHYEQRTTESIARLESVTSAAYLDLTCQLPELLRPKVTPDGGQWSTFLAGFVRVLPTRLPAFERFLAADGALFFGGNSPVAADYFVFEAIDAWLGLLGPPFAAALEACPKLQRQRTALLERPTLKAYVASGRRPLPLTASALEPDIRGRLRAHVLAQRATADHELPEPRGS